MTGIRRSLAQLPPFLAGLVAAVTVETSTGLLLYTENGFLPAMTLILTIEMGALAFGLWGGSLPLGGGVVEKIRRRWLFSLVVFALASALSAGLDFLGDGSGTVISQGFGLGFLGALPLFALGSLLGAMGRAGQPGSASMSWATLPPFGASSVLGAAAGFLVAGLVLIPNAAPYSIYLFSLVALSGGALVQGWVLDGWPIREVLEVVSGPTGDWRAEARALGRSRRELKVIVSESRVRGAEDLTGAPGRPWEKALLERLLAAEDRPGSLLYLGGGSGTLARALSRGGIVLAVQTVERSPELVALAESTFAGGEEGVVDDQLSSDEGRTQQPGMRIGEILERAPPDRTYPLVVVDGEALPTLGSSPFLREEDWRFLSKAVDPGGALVIGGLGSSGGRSTSAINAFASGATEWFDGVMLFRALDEHLDHELLPDMGDEQYVLVCSPSVEPAWPFIPDGFEALSVAKG